MNSSVCVAILLLLCLENVAGIICKSHYFSKPEPPLQENTPTTNSPVQEILPTTEKPQFTNCFEGTEANIVCESAQRHHQWFQAYQNNTSKTQLAIGNIPLQREVKITRYVITLEKFDANTVIYCKNTHDVSKNPFDWLSNTILKMKYLKTRIQLFDDPAPPKIEAPKMLQYSEKQYTSFSCEEYANEKNYTFVGVINTTSNMIKTYPTMSAHQKFNITDNGTVLCCLYFNVSGTADERQITRHVTKKTLLVYDETVQQDRLEGNDMTSADSEAGQTSNQTTTIYITTAVAGVFILLVIVVIYRKRCRKKPTSDSKVLYVDLDLLRNVRPDSISRPSPEEESPYAQIIGVLKPGQ